MAEDENTNALSGTPATEMSQATAATPGDEKSKISRVDVQDKINATKRSLEYLETKPGASIPHSAKNVAAKNASTATEGELEDLQREAETGEREAGAEENKERINDVLPLAAAGAMLASGDPLGAAAAMAADNRTPEEKLAAAVRGEGNLLAALGMGAMVPVNEAAVEFDKGLGQNVPPPPKPALDKAFGMDLPPLGKKT